MPNAMNAKYKPQLVKVEKENENKHIRRKNTALHKDKSTYGKSENVWERLSKVRKSASNEDNVAHPSKSKMNLRTKSNHRMQPQRSGIATNNTNPGRNHAEHALHYHSNIPWQTCGRIHAEPGNFTWANNPTSQPKKPLSPHNRRDRNDRKPIMKKKPIRSIYDNIVVEEIPFCSPVQAVKEILTARSMCNSKSSSDESKYLETITGSSKIKHACSCQTEIVNVQSHNSHHSNCPNKIHILSPSHSHGYSPTQSQSNSPRQSQLNSPHKSNSNSPSNSPRSYNYSRTNCPSYFKAEKHMVELKRPSTLDQTSSFSHGSEEVYHEAPLLQDSTKESHNSSAAIQNDFEHMLKKKQRSMAPDEIKLIKRVVKADERCRQLHQSDERLFKDILKTQLKDILQQGSIVKSALHLLDASESNDVLPSSSTTEKSVAFSELPEKQQVNVIFKNVPSLEKEIIILRALGEKLEATLKRTSSQRTLHITERRSQATSMVVLRQMKIIHCLFYVEPRATMTVRAMGIRRVSGIVKEFNIAHKTIVQLKEESDRHFYLPLEGDHSDLKRTSFRKLKQNPDVLMRHLKPKNSTVAFNVLEQDPVFFNSFLFNMSNMPRSMRDSAQPSYKPRCTPEDGSEESNQNLCLHEGGDSTAPGCISMRHNMSQDSCRSSQNDDFKFKDDDYLKTDKEISKQLKPRVTFRDEVAKGNKKPLPPLPPKRTETKLQVVETPSVKQPNKRRHKRTVTPMPLYKYPEPKNHLLKTILVGSLQISVFLLLIMAITYPDLKC